MYSTRRTSQRRIFLRPITQIITYLKDTRLAHRRKSSQGNCASTSLLQDNADINADIIMTKQVRYPSPSNSSGPDHCSELVLLGFFKSDLALNSKYLPLITVSSQIPQAVSVDSGLSQYSTDHVPPVSNPRSRVAVTEDEWSGGLYLAVKCQYKWITLLRCMGAGIPSSLLL